MYLVVGVLWLVTVASCRLTLSNYTASWALMNGYAVVTPTALSLPDGSVYPLVEGIYDNEGVRVQIHPANNHITIVRRGELIWIDSESRVRRQTLPTSARFSNNETQQACSVQYHLMADVVALMGLTVAQSQLASVAAQTLSIFAQYSDIALPMALSTIDSIDLGLYTSADWTLDAFRIQITGTETPAVCAQYACGQRSFADSTIGIAYVGGGCIETYNVGMIFNLLDAHAAVLTLAHELGHTMGAVHDTSNHYLMYPILADNTLAEFSPTSLNALRDWTAAADCLTTLNQSTHTVPSSDKLSLGVILGISAATTVVALLGIFVFIRVKHMPAKDHYFTS
jgi:hypothetical protein